MLQIDRDKSWECFCFEFVPVGEILLFVDDGSGVSGDWPDGQC